MVKINYRIIADVKYLKSLDVEMFNHESDIEGFFELLFDGHNYGYYHNRPLQTGEEGWELITTWFNSLLEAYLSLIENNYAAIDIIESYNTWIELKRDSNNIVVSLVKAGKNNSSYVISKPLVNCEYGEWYGVKIGLDEYRNEIIKKASEYLDEIEKINSSILGSKRMVGLISLIDRIKS